MSFGIRLVRRIHKLVKDLMGCFNSFIKLLHICSKRDRTEGYR